MGLPTPYYDDGQVAIATRPIARDLGISRRQTIKALAALERMKLLTREQTRQGATQAPGPMQYTLHLPSSYRRRDP